MKPKRPSGLSTGWIENFVVHCPLQSCIICLELIGNNNKRVKDLYDKEELILKCQVSNKATKSY